MFGHFSTLWNKVLSFEYNLIKLILLSILPSNPIEEIGLKLEALNFYLKPLMSLK